MHGWQKSEVKKLSFERAFNAITYHKKTCIEHSRMYLEYVRRNQKLFFSESFLLNNLEAKVLKAWIVRISFDFTEVFVSMQSAEKYSYWYLIRFLHTKRKGIECQENMRKGYPIQENTGIIVKSYTRKPSSCIYMTLNPQAFLLFSFLLKVLVYGALSRNGAAPYPVAVYSSIRY